MFPPAFPPDFSAEQRELWQHVHALWQLSTVKNRQRIRDARHADGVGRDMSAALPHDRDTAVRSVTGEAPSLSGCEPEALSLRIGEGMAGVVHGRCRAAVQPQGGSRWLMVAASGRPGPAEGSGGDGAPAARGEGRDSR